MTVTVPTIVVALPLMAMAGLATWLVTRALQRPMIRWFERRELQGYMRHGASPERAAELQAERRSMYGQEAP